MIREGGPGTDDADTAEGLKHAQETVLGLLAGLSRPPRTFRLRAGAIEVELEWPEAGSAVVVAAPPDTAPDGPVDTGRYVTAQNVGVFYRSPEPGSPPFVDVGDVVSAGQQVGIVEAMKLMIPAESELGGRVTEVLVGDGEPVEYGTRLFALAAAQG